MVCVCLFVYYGVGLLSLAAFGLAVVVRCVALLVRAIVGLAVFHLLLIGCSVSVSVLTVSFCFGYCGVLFGFVYACIIFLLRCFQWFTCCFFQCLICGSGFCFVVLA